MTPAELIARNLAALPHPDGTPRQLAGFNSQLMPEAMAEQVNQTATDIGESIVHLLTTSGYDIVPAGHTTPPPDDDKPAVASVYCTYCDARTLQLNITNPARVMIPHHFALQECPQR